MMTIALNMLIVATNILSQLGVTLDSTECWNEFLPLNRTYCPILSAISPKRVIIIVGGILGSIHQGFLII